MGTGRSTTDLPGLSVSGIGALVRRYVVIEEVGRGGMGRVLRAYDPKLQREVALKEVHAEALAALQTPGGSRAEARDTAKARLVAEARAMAKVSHPNVVAVYDVEEIETRAGTALVVVMEFVEGTTLRAWLRGGQHAWRDIVARFVAAGRGLCAAHAAGLLHRDFKPANVLVAGRPGVSDEIVRVTDFGIAKATSAMAPGVSLGAESNPRGELTEAGVVMGTPRYMAPEQYAGAALGPAADQYAFCVALWEALCGAPPFESSEGGAEKASGPPAWKGPKLPARLIDALRRGLAPDPDDRWPSLDELLDVLTVASGRRRSGRLPWLIGAALVATAGVVSWSWAATGRQSCTGASTALAGTWDDTQRSRVDEAIRRAAPTYAEVVSELVIREIDEYTDAWANEYTEACAATTVRGEQSAEVMDLRMSCLKRAKVDLDAIVEVLAEADRDVAARAHRIATGLRPLSECSDIERLRAEVVPPRPEDVAAVEGAREALATAKAESKAGRYEDALRRVEDAKVQLASVDYEPVRAEVAVLEGALFEYLGRYEDAEAALKRALGYAARTHQARILGRTGIRLMGVVGYQQRRFAVGLRYASVAHALTSHDPAADADMHNVIGNILDAQGHYADAEAEYRRALAYTVEAGEDSEPWTAAWISNLANAIDSQGRYDEAEAEHRRALKLKETILGPDHPSVALGHNNLASVLMSRGKYADAEAEARRALEIWEQALGPDHPSVANALHNLGNAVYSQGRPADAEVFYRRGLTLLEQTLGPDHPKVGSALTNLGAAVSSSGDQEEAERLFRRALDIERSALGPEHPKLINVRISLAIVLNAQGKLDEAEAEHRAALQLALKTMGPNHPIVGNVRGNLALVLAAEGKSREAEAEFRESLRLREQRLGPEHPDVAYARFGLAKHLAAQDRIDEARSLARRALEVYIQQDRTEDAERVSTWLDEVH